MLVRFGIGFFFGREVDERWLPLSQELLDEPSQSLGGLLRCGRVLSAQHLSSSILRRLRVAGVSCKAARYQLLPAHNPLWCHRLPLADRQPCTEDTFGYLHTSWTGSTDAAPSVWLAGWRLGPVPCGARFPREPGSTHTPKILVPPWLGSRERSKHANGTCQ